MKLKFFVIVLTGMLLVPAIIVKGQGNDYPDSVLINVAREIMISVPCCAFITLDREETPRVRAMETMVPDEDMTTWFVTNPNSRKVQQIENNPKVTLYYLDNDLSGYVTIHGNAFLVNDQKQKEKLWKEQWIEHYPNKYDDCLLIKVVPKWMEVLSMSRGIKNDSVTWQPPGVTF